MKTDEGNEGKKPTFLMCPPDFFLYPREYGKINSFMKKMRNVDIKKASTQWNNLKETLIYFGANVVCMPAARGLPDMVFTRNGGMLLSEKKVILSNFATKERRLERAHFFSWFSKQGYDILFTREDIVFEGNGEAMLWKDKMFVGFGSTRAQFPTVRHLAHLLNGACIGNLDIVPLRLSTKDFYHLDTCFMPISRAFGYADILVYYPPAFDDLSLKRIENLSCVTRVPVSKHDAHVFGCNLIAFGNVVIMPKGTKDLAAKLREYKYDGCKRFEVYEIDVSEFIECGGGGPFCMTLRVV